MRSLVVQHVLDEPPGGSDVHRTLADDEVVRRRRFEAARSPVLVPPDVLRPYDWTPETWVKVNTILVIIKILYYKKQLSK